MAIFTLYCDADGFGSVEMTPVERTITISRELVEHECALGVFMSRDRNMLTIHTREGDWTYRLVGYNTATMQFRGQLIESDVSRMVVSRVLTPNEARRVTGLDWDGLRTGSSEVRRTALMSTTVPKAVADRGIYLNVEESSVEGYGGNRSTGEVTVTVWANEPPTATPVGAPAATNT